MRGQGGNPQGAVNRRGRNANTTKKGTPTNQTPGWKPGAFMGLDSARVLHVSGQSPVSAATNQRTTRRNGSRKIFRKKKRQAFAYLNVSDWRPTGETGCWSHLHNKVRGFSELPPRCGAPRPVLLRGDKNRSNLWLAKRGLDLQLC